MLRSKRRMISEQVRQHCSQVCSSLIDLVLSELAIASVVVEHPGAAHSLPRLQRLSRELRDTWDEQKLLNAIRKLRERGWISKDLRPTREGQRRVHGFLPPLRKEGEWTEKWYIVTFDIPERLRMKRARLRSILQAFGYVSLHRSVWVSPQEFFGDIQKFLNEERLQDFVIFSVSEALGTKGSKRLVNGLWHTDAINERYRQWVHRCEKAKAPSTELFFWYCSIARSDPGLPDELLPKPWYGREAKEIFETYFPLTSINGYRRSFQ